MVYFITAGPGGDVNLWEEKDDSLTDLITHKDVCRTAQVP